MKVTIENFQSIEKATLEIKGFTVIVGRSNIGKSAIVRAIEGALDNASGDSFVRKDTSFSQVRLESPGMDLTWKKGGGFNDYMINGEAFESVGRGAPPVIADLGFKSLDVAKTTVPVQVASQFDPIFLLDSSKVSGSVAAEVVSDVGRLGELQEALRNVAKDRRSLESTQKVRRKDLKQAQKEVASFHNLQEISDLREKLLKDRAHIQTLEAEIEGLKKFSRAYKEAREIYDKWSFVSEVSVPLERVSQSLEDLQVCQSMYDDFQHTQKLLRELPDVGRCELPTEDFDPRVKKIRALANFQSLAKNASDTLKDHKTLPDIQDFSSGLLEELRQAQEVWSDYVRAREVLPLLKRASEDLVGQTAQVEKEIHDMFDGLDVCPLCDQEIS